MMMTTTTISMVIQFSQGCAGFSAGRPIALRSESSGPAKNRLNSLVVHKSTSCSGIDQFKDELEEHSRRGNQKTRRRSRDVQSQISDYTVGQNEEQQYA